MRIRDWRTRRVIAAVLSYWTALLVVIGASYLRSGAAAMTAYKAKHPGQQDFLVSIDAGVSAWVILALVVLPPIMLIGYRIGARRGSATRPAV